MCYLVCTLCFCGVLVGAVYCCGCGSLRARCCGCIWMAAVGWGVI